MTDNSCVIVGAGMAGLLAANELRDNGWRVVVLDKGRGVGGRMATRRVGDGNFDHGTQFFTVRGDRFGELVESLMSAGVVEEWTRGFTDASGERSEDGHPRYRGAEGMTSIPKYLARDLDVRTGERVVRINLRDDVWEVVAESGMRVEGASLILTAPVPQSLALASSGDFGLPDEVRRELEKVAYDPCLALMALLDGPAVVSEPGGMQIKDEPLDWIGDNRQKGISEANGITIHAGPGWSRDHYDEPEEEISRQLLDLAGQQLGTSLEGKVLDTSLARWRYSWVTNAHQDSYLAANEEPPLLFAGDAFGQPKVEGASLSGLAAADRLLGREQ